jgi:hypothetical protein
MKPLAPKPIGSNKKKPMLDPKRSNDPVRKGLEFLFGDKSNPNVKKKPGASKVTPNRRGLPERKVELLPKRGNQPSPKMPIPSGPRKPKATARPAPTGPRKSRGVVITPKAKKPSPSNKTNYGPLPKNPTLNDYLMRGIRPPSRNKPGSRPSDSDVILKKYNDKKYKGK